MRNIGLVLSGGMAKGAYQIGALRAIKEFFKPSDFRYISSASIGALNSYIFLTQELDKGIEIWKGADEKNNRKWVTAVLKNGFLQESIKNIISKEEIKNIFYIPLVNLKKRKLSYIDVGKVPAEGIESYLRASVAMPIFNPGVLINGEYYYDGAIVDNIPIQPILKHSIDYVICIYFDDYNYTFESEYLDNKIIKMNFSDDKILSNSLSFNGESIEYMINEGYTRGRRILDYILINGIDDIDSIYSRIEDLNAMNTNKSLRITGDVIVNNMNKITKRLIKRMEIL